MKYNEVQWSTMMYKEVQWSAMKYNEVQWSTTKYSELQWSTMKYNEVLYINKYEGRGGWVLKSRIQEDLSPPKLSGMKRVSGDGLKGVQNRVLEGRSPSHPFVFIDIE